NLAVAADFAPDGGVGIDALDLPPRSIRLIKARMGHACYKASLWPQHTRNLLKGSLGILNIHKRHVADDQIKRAIFQHIQASCIRDMIGDTQCLLRFSRTNTLNERRISIHAGNDGPLTCEPATQVTIPTSQIQHMQSVHLASKAKQRQINQRSMPEI